MALNTFCFSRLSTATLKIYFSSFRTSCDLIFRRLSDFLLCWREYFKRFKPVSPSFLCILSANFACISFTNGESLPCALVSSFKRSTGVHGLTLTLAKLFLSFFASFVSFPSAKLFRVIVAFLLPKELTLLSYLDYSKFLTIVIGFFLLDNVTVEV